jgi:hypothetical protein
MIDLMIFERFSDKDQIDFRQKQFYFIEQFQILVLNIHLYFLLEIDHIQLIVPLGFDDAVFFVFV